MNPKTSSALAALYRAKLRILRRTLWDNAFTLFVLGPLIVGGFWFILQPTLARAAEWTQAAADGLGDSDQLAIGLALSILLTAAGIPSALREVFAIRTPDSTLDALPMQVRWRFGLISITQTLRNLPAFIALWAGLALLSAVAGGEFPRPGKMIPAMAVLGIVQILGALLLLHGGQFRTGRLLAIAAAALGLAWVVRDVPQAVWLSGPLAPPAAFFANKIEAALHGPAPAGFWAHWLTQLGVMLFLRIWVPPLYGRWREDDRELAERALTQRRRLLAGVESRLRGAFGLETAALLARDLRLALRGFVPATTVAIAAAVLCLSGGFLAGAQLEPVWRGLAAQLGVALGCLSMSALAPLMLARQLPMHWLELSSGAAPQSLWKSKTWLALLVSAPVLLVGCALAPTLGLDGWSLAAFAARIALGWVTMATIIGLLAFEIAPSPVLGLLLGGLFAVGVCGFYAIPNYWPIGLFLYAYVMNALKERASLTASRLGAQV